MFLCLCFFAVLAMLPEPFSLWETLQNVYRQFPFYYFIEEKAQETWLELDGETLAEIGKRNGEYLGELAEAERNLEGKDTKKSDAANLEKNSDASEVGKKENSTDKLETNSEDKAMVMELRIVLKKIQKRIQRVWKKRKKWILPVTVVLVIQKKTLWLRKS